jgi:hypothetical protein
MKRREYMRAAGYADLNLYDLPERIKMPKRGGELGFSKN